MKLGMVGLGKMGANMTERLLKGGHELVVTDLNMMAVKKVADDGAIAANGLKDLVKQLDAPRIIWVMVPAGAPTEKTVSTLGDMLDAGDIVIDGGNSNYKETMQRGKALAEKGIQFVDVGTSGGVWGLTDGYSMMIGGDEDTVKSLTPIFETLAPSPETGWGYVGPSGAGHFVKMVHNGIEYGMMQAFAEGFAIFNKKEEFNLDLAEISRIWLHGSVVRSWLLDLIHDALQDDQQLEKIAAFVPDSGEGRWTVVEAIDLNVSAPVITTALQERFRSRDDNAYADKLLSVMRNQFGGHKIKKSGE
jgi:6-phosphogluconate dehydrogenase